MAESQWLFLAAVLLLVSQGSQCSPVLPTRPGPCPCQRGPLLNCSSSGLSVAPGRIQATVTELDLSHNLLSSLTLRRPNRNIQNLWLGSNAITHLSLCMGRTVTSQDVKRVGPHPSGPQSRRACLSWAPALQLLSVERNQLLQLPEGLGGSESLRVLQLSYNRISTLRPGDLSSLLQLRELHLQHNHLTSLHPQAFRNLSQLRVLNLSFNLLSSLPPSTYLSLRNLRAEVGLRGNRWRCDCSLRAARRWMLYDGDRGQPAWRLVCDSPPALSGRDLLQLEEGDLTCTTADTGPALHQDVTVHEGSEILLQCSSTHKDSTWWTPNGQVSVTRSETGLLIRDITERDTGLYVCMSESQQQLASVFNLQIWKTGRTRRKTRSPGSSPWGSQLVIPLQGIWDRVAQVRNATGTTQSDDLALAVSLSVIFTFLVAFILGVLARPLIDILWRRICTKKSSSATYSVSSAEHRPYDNDGYSDGEEPGEISAHRERRVTFSTVDFREHSQASNSNVPYYDTVASVNQVSNPEGAVKDSRVSVQDSGATCVGVQEGGSSLSSSVVGQEKKKPEGSDSDSSSQQDSPKDERRGQKYLPDVTHPGTTHSVEFEHIPDPEDLRERRSSSSNSSHSDQERNKEQMAQKVEDTPQQKSQSPTVRLVEVPQIAIDGTSEIPGFSSEPFADWPPNKNELEMWNDSGDSFEFTDSFRGASPRSSSLLGSLAHSKQSTFSPSDNRKRPDSTSSSSTLSSDEPTNYTVNPEREEDEDTEASQNTQFTHDTKPDSVNPYRTQDVSFEQKIHSEDPFKPSVPEEGFNQGDSRWETQSPPMGSRHSHSSTSGDEYTANEDSNEEKIRASDKSASVVVTTEGDRAEEISPAPRTYIEPKAKQPDLTPGVPSVKKKRKAPLPPAAAASSSSSSESDTETTDHMVRQHRDGAKEGTTSEEPETRWPDLSHQSIPKIKRRLDIKAPSPDTSSSGGGSEDVMGTTLSKLQITSQRTETERPDPGLSSVPNTKRHLDVKAPSTPKSSSSSSEDKNADHKVEQGEEEATVPEITYKQPPNNPAPLPRKRAVGIKSDSSASSADEREERARQDLSSTSTKVGPEPGSKWPDLAPVIVPRIKRRLDIKAPSPPHSESSSSSESDNETKDHTVYQERDRIDVGVTSHEPNTKWPEIDLQSIPKIKRRLDIKAPSPPDSESSSSSESDNETKYHTVYQERDRIDVGVTSHEPNTKWPEIDLQSIPKIKRRLDIKAPSPPHSESSSSSESDNETKEHTVYQERDRIDVGVTSHEPNTKWPEIDLQSIPKIKRRLDIKAPSPPDSESSSSSESDNETKDHTVYQERDRIDVGVTSHEPNTKWPEIDLQSIPKIKRRLDIKAPSPPDSESSSSSESDNETKDHTVYQERDRIDVGITSHEPNTKWPEIDLQSIPKIKRRLDIKAPSPPHSESSSSSESDNETKDHTVYQERDRIDVGITSHEPNTKWPEIDLQSIPKIKRRLDIKAPSPPDSESSSSSESDNETKDHTVYQERDRIDVGVTSHEPNTKWPEIDLQSIPKIKRRLDIKAPSPPDSESSSSSESDNETKDHTVYQERDRIDVGITSHEPNTKWPEIDLQSIPKIKRRLDIKVPSPPPYSSSSSGASFDNSAAQGPLPAESSSSSSESDGENKDYVLKQEGEVVMVKVIGSLTPKMAQNIKLENHASITNEKERTWAENISPAPKVNQDTKWAGLGLSIPHIKKRLNIISPKDGPPKVPTIPPPKSSSSSSESEDERKDPQIIKKKGFTYNEESSLSHVDKSMSVSLTLTSADNIYSNYSGEVRDRSTIDYSFPATEAKPDPGAMWTGLGVPSVRRRLDIKIPEEAPPAVPPSLPPDSSSSGESEDETSRSKGSGGRAQAAGFPTTDAKPHPGSMWTGLGVPGIKRRLDIKIPEEASSAAPSPRPLDSSSSSESEDDTSGLRERAEVSIVMDKESPQSSDSLYSKRVVHIHFDQSDSSRVEREPTSKWPDLGLGRVPRIKRHLDIKGPSPSRIKSSSSGESEGEATGRTVGQERNRTDVGFASQEPEIKWPDLDLQNMPELQWKGIGRYSPGAISISQEGRAVESALSTSHLRQVDVDMKLTQRAPPTVTGGPPPSPLSSSSESGDEIAQDGEKPKITLSHEYSSIGPGSVSLAHQRAVDMKFDNSSTRTDVTDWKARSEDRKERRGMTTLKAMSSNRQTWETVQEEQLTVSYSVRQDQSITYPTSTIFKSSEKHRESLAKMSAPEPPISTILPDEVRAAGSTHRISRLRRHAVVGFQAGQETPPPVPETAPPVEVAAGSTWRSPQRQDWSSMGSHLQKEMSVDAYVSSSMSSKSRRDEGQSPSFIGATPYHAHTAPKRYHSVTSSTTTKTLRTDCEESDTSSTISKKHPLFDHSNSISEV